MAINDAISLKQLKKSVFNMKNYINNNMDSNNIYKGYQELIAYSFNINKNCIPEDGFFDFTFNTSNNYNVFYKVIELDKEYDFSDGRNYVKREITSKNYDLTNGKGNNIYETNCPHSLIYIITGYNNENNIDIMTNIYYGRKYYLDESTGKSAYEKNNKYVSIMYQANLSKIDTSVDHDYSDTLEIKFSLNEFNTNTLLQFPLYKANKSSIVPVNIDDSVTIGEHSISLSNNSDIPPRSYIAGDNDIPYSYTSSYLSVFGYSNYIKMISFGLIGGGFNTLDSYYTGAGMNGVLCIGSRNNFKEKSGTPSKDSYLGIVGNNIKCSQAGFYVGTYGTVPYTEMFAICNGSTNEDKVLFSVNRTTGAVSSISTPTEDNHLTTKKYVDEKVAGIVDSAPETLDTLKELATALGNDPNFATTVSTQIGKKVDKVDGMSLTHNDLTNELKANYDAAYAYSQAKHSYNDLTDKPVIPSIAGLATEEYVNNKVTDTATSLTNDPDIYLTKDKYQYVTGVNTVDNIIWLPSTDLPAFLKIHLYVTNCKMQSNFDTLVTWKSGQNPNEGKFKIISDNIYEFILTYINGSWIGEVVTYSNTEYTPTNDADVTTKKYVDDRLNNLNIKTVTQSEYDSLESKEPNTLYLITD